MTREYSSWGRYPHARETAIVRPLRNGALSLGGAENFLPYGNGRSYGDSCRNDGGGLIDCRHLNRILEFDPETGRIKAEAGVLLCNITTLTLGSGWFLPVTPGTQFVTLGGAVANDVHGKNHHEEGTLGCHVQAFELLRSDGSRRVCSPEANAEWFSATIGGLGITGLITWVELKLKRVPGSVIAQRSIRYNNLTEFFELVETYSQTHEHSVAWVDSLAKADRLGRGILLLGNHVEDLECDRDTVTTRPKLDVFLKPPFSVLNRATLTAFNTIHFHSHRGRVRDRRVPLKRFFYPLDGIRRWNRLYGPHGLLQHQCVVPLQLGQEVISTMLARVNRCGAGSFLTVAKTFGERTSPGLLSFPRHGVTLTLDFPNTGRQIFDLLDDLDCIVGEARGAVNPYKDARMSGETFRASFPNWEAIIPFIDPAFSSSFWRRVTGSQT